MAGPIPKIVQHLANGLSGDLLALPDDRRPDGATLLATLVRASDGKRRRVTMQPPHPSSPAERLAWMDTIGIDHCLVNPGSWWQAAPDTSDPTARGAAICNDWLASRSPDGGHRLHGGGGRLHRPRRRRRRDGAETEQGHRAFFLYTIDGRPPRATPPGHPEWDVVWSAATDLGMVAVIHIGNTYADYGGWADIGWDLPGGAGVSALVRLSLTKHHHVAEDLLSSLLFGGAFHRHPNLTVVLEEMGVGWIPSYVVDLCGRQSIVHDDGRLAVRAQR
jgi:predicted TIM-barrel fold metal-dependent hydrolase